MFNTVAIEFQEFVLVIISSSQCLKLYRIERSLNILINATIRWSLGVSNVAQRYQKANSPIKNRIKSRISFGTCSCTWSRRRFCFWSAWLIVGHPVRVCFTWKTGTRVYTRRRKLSARATPRNSLVSPLVVGWPRSIRMSIRITTTERARNNFCSWDWSHWMDRRSFQLTVLHIRAAVPPFQSSSLQEKTARLSSFSARPIHHYYRSNLPFWTISDRTNNWSTTEGSTIWRNIFEIDFSLIFLDFIT